MQSRRNLAAKICQDSYGLWSQVMVSPQVKMIPVWAVRAVAVRGVRPLRAPSLARTAALVGSPGMWTTRTRGVAPRVSRPISATATSASPGKWLDVRCNLWILWRSSKCSFSFFSKEMLDRMTSWEKHCNLETVMVGAVKDGDSVWWHSCQPICWVSTPCPLSLSLWPLSPRSLMPLVSHLLRRVLWDSQCDWLDKREAESLVVGSQCWWRYFAPEKHRHGPCRNTYFFNLGLANLIVSSTSWGGLMWFGLRGRCLHEIRKKYDNSFQMLMDWNWAPQMNRLNAKNE